LAAPPELVWRHLTEPDLLGRWWAPYDLRVSELVFEPRPGGRLVVEYRDAEDLDGSGPVVGRAEGTVDEVRRFEQLGYRSSPLLPDGAPAFTTSVDLELRPTPDGTDLVVGYRITDSSVDAAEFVAGIELGFGQSLDQLAAVVAAASTATHPDTTNTTNTGSTK
jgi:uncharacterized protein YndB with AHSA1/START domain